MNVNMEESKCAGFPEMRVHCGAITEGNRINCGVTVQKEVRKVGIGKDILHVSYCIKD